MRKNGSDTMFDYGGPMKYFLFISVFFLFVSCKAKVNKNEEVTEYKRFEPLMVSAPDFSRIKAICDALSAKESVLSVLVGNDYSFNYSYKGCSEEELSQSSEVPVYLERSGQDFVFKKHSGALFGFSNVETLSKGSMVDICSNLADLKSPLQTSINGAIWFTTFTGPKNCVSDVNHICIQIQKGSHARDMSYKIHTTEWIKFKIRDERIGFFTERLLVSEADCGPGKKIQRKTILIK